MSSNEDYLDSLLRSVSGETSEKQADVRNEENDVMKETNSDELKAESMADTSEEEGLDLEDLEFPELARLFDEEPDEAETEENQEAEKPEILPEPEIPTEPETEPAPLPESEVESASEGPEEPAVLPEPETESGETILLSDAETEEPALLPETESGESDMSGEPEALLSAGDMEEAVLPSDLDAGVDDAGILPDVDLGEEAVPDLDIADLEALMAPEEAETGDGTVALPEPSGIMDLMDPIDEDSELAEISEMLSMSDGGPVLDDDDDDMKSLMESLSRSGVETEEDIAGGEAEEIPQEAAEERKGLFGRKKDKKAKKQKDSPKAGATEKGPGLFKKLFAFFLDEDEFDDIGEDKGQLDLSQENIAILEGLDKDSRKKKRNPSRKRRKNRRSQKNRKNR